MENEITEYEKEIMKRTGWDLEFVRIVLKRLDENSYSPSDKEYYLGKISPF